MSSLQSIPSLQRDGPIVEVWSGVSHSQRRMFSAASASTSAASVRPLAHSSGVRPRHSVCPSTSPYTRNWRREALHPTPLRHLPSPSELSPSLERTPSNNSPTRARAFQDPSSFLTSAAPALFNGQDVAATGGAFILAALWVRIWDELAARNVLDSKLSRKLVHITTGLLFMTTWPFFSGAFEARFFAAAIPAANILRLSLLGLGITKNEAVVKAVSREGNPRELLRGPLFYVVTLTLATALFWRTSPVGVVALVMMCGGDGIADIVGRRIGSSRLPWNERKSWAGSIAMFAFGFALSWLFVYLFCSLGFYSCHWWSLSSCSAIALIALGATLVESLPISTKLDDNFTVPLTSVVLGLILLPQI